MYSDYGYYDSYAALTTILPIILLLCGAIGFIFYIFKALGVYQISKKRGYKNAWLAFIPVANSYVLGGITDNINFCYGKKSNFRIWLLVLSVINAVLMFFSFFTAIRTAFDVIQFSYIDEMVVARIMMSLTAFYTIGSLFSLAILILSYICMYKIYSDYDGKNAMVFLILSILLNLSPFLLFAIKNKPSMSLYYAAQRNNQPPYQPPFNGQGQPPFNTQGQSPYQQPPFNTQGQPPYQSPANYNQPQQPPVINQAQSPYQRSNSNQSEQIPYENPPQDPPQTPEG